MSKAAFSRIELGIISRAHRDGNAVKTAAYNASCRLTDDHGREFDFSRKRAEHHAHEIMLPPGSPPSYRDPGILWRAAEASERRSDAQVARQILISIPREVPRSEWLPLAREIAAGWVANGMAVQLDIHCPRAADGGEQPHIHFQLSLRRLTDAGFAPKKERAWNAIFADFANGRIGSKSNARSARSDIADNMNAFFVRHMIEATVDPRSLAARGEDRTLEPLAPRKDWQQWRRQGADPDAAPETVARVLMHRRMRAVLAAAQADARTAADKAKSVTAAFRKSQTTGAHHVRPTQKLADIPPFASLHRLSALPVLPHHRRPGGPSHILRSVALRGPRGRVGDSRHGVQQTRDSGSRTGGSRVTTPPQETTMATRTKPRPAGRRTIATEAWMRRAGGYEAMSDDMQSAARRSYERWKEQHADAARRYDFAAYVAYVQGRQAEQAGEDIEGVGENAPPTIDGIAPASLAAGDDRRHAMLAGLLADHYSAPTDLAALIQRIDRDRENRTATLHLRDGSRVVDHGDRLEHQGAVTEAAAQATTAAAAAHGWSSVRLTGSAAYRDAIAVACALRQPPITTDHVLPPAAAERVREALARRAAAGVAPLDPASLRVTAARTPAVAANQFLSYAEARARAVLAGRPTGSTDPAEISRPLVAEMITRRELAREDAREAIAAASAHRQAHGWTARLLDGSARRRQNALDQEAARLDKEARRLDRGHEKAVRAVEKAARRTAISNATTMEDWRWSPAVRKSEAQLAALAAVRGAIAAGTADTIAHAARGDFSNAAKSAAAHTKAAATPQDARTAAVQALHGAEASAVRDPAALVRARVATAAALAGDAATIAAAASGDTGAAQAAGEQWKRQQEKERRGEQQQHAHEYEPEAPTYS